MTVLHQLVRRADAWTLEAFNTSPYLWGPRTAR
jgi:hypothetical protein